MSPTMKNRLTSVEENQEHTLLTGVDEPVDELLHQAHARAAEDRSAGPVREQVKDDALLARVLTALDTSSLPRATRWFLTQDRVLAAALRSALDEAGSASRGTATADRLAAGIATWGRRQLALRVVQAAQGPPVDPAFAARGLDPEEIDWSALQRAFERSVEEAPLDNVGDYLATLVPTPATPAPADPTATSPSSTAGTAGSAQGTLPGDVRDLTRRSRDIFFDCDERFGDVQRHAASVDLDALDVARDLMLLYQFSVKIPLFHAMRALKQQVAAGPVPPFWEQTYVGGDGHDGSDATRCDLLQAVMSWDEDPGLQESTLLDATAALGLAGTSGTPANTEFRAAMEILLGVLWSLADDRACCEKLPRWAAGAVEIAAYRAFSTLSRGVTARTQYLTGRWMIRHQLADAVLRHSAIRQRLNIAGHVDPGPAPAVRALLDPAVDPVEVVDESVALDAVFTLLRSVAEGRSLGPDDLDPAVAAAVVLHVLRSGAVPPGTAPVGPGPGAA